MNANMAGRAVLVTRIGHIMVRSLGWDTLALAAEVARAVVAFQA